MKLVVEIEIKENPFNMSENELKEDIECVLRDYLNGQGIRASISYILGMDD